MDPPIRRLGCGFGFSPSHEGKFSPGSPDPKKYHNPGGDFWLLLGKGTTQAIVGSKKHCNN